LIEGEKTQERKKRSTPSSTAEAREKGFEGITGEVLKKERVAR